MDNHTLSNLITTAAIYRKATKQFSEDAKIARDMPSKRAECLRLAYEYATLTKATTEFLIDVFNEMPKEERNEHYNRVREAMKHTGRK